MTTLVTLCLVLLLAAVALLVVLLRRTGGQSSGAGQAVRDELRAAREESAVTARALREELANSQTASATLIVKTIGELGKGQGDALSLVTKEIKELAGANETRLDQLRGTVDEKLKELRESNEAKLEEMRTTVDEKLQKTLESRLGESFRQVSERLEAVQAGLGEMRTLATGVGDLKKVLSNVKTRGTLGEWQLSAILENILSPGQYDANVQTKEGSRDNVEYAVRLPGSDGDSEKCVWLPIDSKFPQEDYQRLVDASEAGDAAAVKDATNGLVRAVKASAKEIREKYVGPPATTDFAIMFLPTEGLYGEVLRQPGLVDELMRKERIYVAGPTTLDAILNSFRVVFGMIAIEARSGEVRQILGAVKTEFRNFGGVIDRLKKQLDSARNTVDKTGVRTRAMERVLRDIEAVPEVESTNVLRLDSADAEDAEVVRDEAAGDED